MAASKRSLPMPRYQDSTTVLSSIVVIVITSPASSGAQAVNLHARSSIAKAFVLC